MGAAAWDNVTKTLAPEIAATDCGDQPMLPAFADRVRQRCRRVLASSRGSSYRLRRNDGASRTAAGGGPAAPVEDPDRAHG